MRISLFIGLILSVFSLSSCIEIVDDIKLNADGSGTINYNINLSASKVKINSIFALDSLDGKKMPSREEVRQQILNFKNIFEKKEGILDVALDMDFENFLFKWKVDFSNLEALQLAVKSSVVEITGKEELFPENSIWLTFKGDKMTRSIPEVKNNNLKKLKVEEIELLHQGSYISITRFDKEVPKFDNPKAVLSKNKKAVMIKADAYSLSQDFNILENNIYLQGQKSQ